MTKRRPGRPRKDRLKALASKGAGHKGHPRYGPTPQQRRKRQALIGASAPEHLSEYPLGILFARGLIDSDQLEAGCRYARLFRLAIGGEGLASVNLSGKVLDAPGEGDEAWLAARSRDYDEARAVLARQGRRTRELVENVTVYQRLPAWVYQGGLPAPGDLKAMARLVAGLGALASHFRRSYRRAA